VSTLYYDGILLQLSCQNGRMTARRMETVGSC